MDWNNSSNLMRTFVPRPDSAFDFLYNNFNYDQFSGMEAKHGGGIIGEKGHGGMMEKNEKKKRLTSDQLESLERSFHEEIKLDPDRKMKLSRDLGLQPRQIAVWFQNRRARWKAKQLELLYDSLKQDFDLVSREKQKLQDEVMKLRSMLREQATRKQVSTGYTEISCEETVESTSVGIRSTTKQAQAQAQAHIGGGGEGNYLFNVEEYNGAVSSALWGSVVLPSANYP